MTAYFLCRVRTWVLEPYLSGVLSAMQLQMPIQEGLAGPIVGVFDAEMVGAIERLLAISRLRPRPVRDKLAQIMDEMIKLNKIDPAAI